MYKTEIVFVGGKPEARATQLQNLENNRGDQRRRFRDTSRGARDFLFNDAGGNRALLIAKRRQPLYRGKQQIHPANSPPFAFLKPFPVLDTGIKNDPIWNDKNTKGSDAAAASLLPPWYARENIERCVPGNSRGLILRFNVTVFLLLMGRSPF